MIDFKYIEPQDLSLDLSNPRFGLSTVTSEAEALKILYETADLKELWNSISERGYEKFEPLVAVIEGGRTVVLEGNRRLATVKILLNPEILGEVARKRVPNLTGEKLESCKSLPVAIVQDRSDAAGYIGFKHVNGPTRWSSLAKAKFGVNFYDGLSEVATPAERLQSLTKQLGDSRGLILRLLVAYKIVMQAIKEGIFDELKVDENSIEFSHLYTLINNPDSRNFIGLGKTPLSERLIIDNPVPIEYLSNLRELMHWLYSSQSVIKSQGVDRPKLQRVLAEEAGIKELRISGNLDSAAAVAGLQNEDWLESIAKMSALAQKIAAEAPIIADDLDDSSKEQAQVMLKRTVRYLGQIDSSLG